MVDIFTYILSFSAFTGVAVFFISLFMTGEIRFSSISKISTAVISVVMFILHMLLQCFKDIPISVPSLMMSSTIIPFFLEGIAMMICLMVYSFIEYKKVEFFNLVLPVFMFHISFILSGVFGSIILDLIKNRLMLDSMIYAEGIDLLLLKTVQLLSLCLLLLILYFTCKKVKSVVPSIIVMLLPNILFFFVVFWYESRYISNAYSVELNRLTNLPDLVYFLLLVFSALFYLGTFFVIYQVGRNIKVEQEREFYKNMIELERKRYKEISHYAKETERLRHDLKNMLLTIKTDVDEHDEDSAMEKLTLIIKETEGEGTFINTGNRTLDHILNLKLSEKAEHINILISGDASGINALSDIDMSILIGNIMDNAIEATDKEKCATIDLSFFVRNQYQVILCKNTITVPVINRNNLFVSTKSDKKHHGFGIGSVKRVVEKYNGITDIYEENGMFCVQVMFPIKNN